MNVPYRRPTDEEQDVVHRIAKRTVIDGVQSAIDEPKLANLDQRMREMGFAKYLVQTLVAFMVKRKVVKTEIRNMCLDWIDEEIAAE